MVHAIYWRFAGDSFRIVFLSLEIVFVIANSVDPDEMCHAAFHLGLQCLPKTQFGVTSIESRKQIK